MEALYQALVKPRPLACTRPSTRAIVNVCQTPSGNPSLPSGRDCVQRTVPTPPLNSARYIDLLAPPRVGPPVKLGLIASIYPVAPDPVGPPKPNESPFQFASNPTWPEEVDGNPPM